MIQNPKIKPNEIRKVMRRLADECRDHLTGEVNHTLLAERAAEKLDCYFEDEQGIPERSFIIPDLLFEIAVEFE